MERVRFSFAALEVEQLSTMNEIPSELSRLISDLPESPVKWKIKEILLSRDAQVLAGSPFFVSLGELIDVFRVRITTATVRTYGLKEMLDVLRAWGEKGGNELIAWHVISARGDFSLYESKAGEVVGAVAVDSKI